MGILDLDTPIIAAPMAGGPTTPELVTAAAQAGGFGFVPGGYKTAPALAEQIAAVRAHAIPFGVNLFAPNPLPVDRAEFRRYAQALQPVGDRLGVDLTAAEPTEDDDYFDEKVATLLDDPVPIVSFTFGIPAADVIARLRRAGTVVVQTVTSADEARAAADAGVDALAVQAAAAGGHSGTLTPDRVPAAVALVDLIGRVRAGVRLPLIAAGGLGTPASVAAALHAGAVAAMVGTALLCCTESGTSAPYRAALAAHRDTVVTRAFTGRPARGLRNDFTEQYDAIAPLGYPAVHHLTSPLRRAATAAGDPEWVNLWAGTGVRYTTGEPAADIIGRLAAAL